MGFFLTLRLAPLQEGEFGLFFPTRGSLKEGRRLALSDHIWGPTMEQTEGRRHMFPIITPKAETKWVRSMLHREGRVTRHAYLGRGGCH